MNILKFPCSPPPSPQPEKNILQDVENDELWLRDVNRHKTTIPPSSLLFPSQMQLISWSWCSTFRNGNYFYKFLGGRCVKLIPSTLQGLAERARKDSFQELDEKLELPREAFDMCVYVDVVDKWDENIPPLPPTKRARGKTQINNNFLGHGAAFKLEYSRFFSHRTMVIW